MQYFFKVVQFCHKIGTALESFSKEGLESMHFDFESTWKLNKVTKSHLDYCGNFCLQCVLGNYSSFWKKYYCIS